MLNICDFIPSPDVAAHCRRIDHVFSQLDKTQIIDRSNKTMKERHAALRGLMRNYPDMPYPEIEADNRIGWQPPEGCTLHECLRAKIEMEEGYLAEFQKPGDGVLYYVYLEETGNCWPYYPAGGASRQRELMGEHSIFAKAVEAVRNEYLSFGWDSGYLQIVRTTFDDEGLPAEGGIPSM